MRRNAKSASPPGLAVPAVVYQNSPLVEVVFEVQFAGEPAVECRRDEFFQKVRDEFPVVAVPNAEPGQAPAIQPYRFQSADGNEMLMVAINRLAYSTRRYGAFEKFAPRALELSSGFCGQFRIKKLTRTGLRYINLIPFLREGGVIPWKHYFAVDLKVPGASCEDILNVGLAYETRTDAGAITTRITAGRSADASREVFILDFDFAKTGDLAAEKLRTYLDESHAHTKRVFEGIVTQEYKAVMRGEVVQ